MSVGKSDFRFRGHEESSQLTRRNVYFSSLFEDARRVVVYVAPSSSVCPSIIATGTFFLGLLPTSGDCSIRNEYAISIRGRTSVRMNVAHDVQETISIALHVQQVAPFRSGHRVLVASDPSIVPNPTSLQRGEQRADDDGVVLAPSITRTRSHLATMEMVLHRTLSFLAAPYWIKGFITLPERCMYVRQVGQ